MANKSGNAYGLTVLSPIINGCKNDTSYGALLRDHLNSLPLNRFSPMAKVPNTYLARFYVLADVFYQGYPAREEHLQSQYLVFSTNFYGDLDSYLHDMWRCAEADVKAIWQHCVAFDQVDSAEKFVEYIKKCQIDNQLFFNGSNTLSLKAQLKSLYLKQEFSRFVYANQGKSAEELQQAFHQFVRAIDIDNLSSPSWSAGASSLEEVADTVHIYTQPSTSNETTPSLEIE
ncbi:conserved hypothetical protein [Vibrio nigripulchritudo MADA3029]|uniref:hypothetical protein n=1 Tax=Vibrio nigripulchritudo TaxID=28173 RepID=UPI0003B195F6|nr:hypothetical protein [Vibrio nigripulchritudo]CCN47424.1 conserved hypothetical protein [Vibrio nigripulchritudo MADA3020]CCN56289.1 conserved hypothetical protein [Vibrio nigripulchritudo MADA3021]CCN58637.1 conserved hypothetical protein [Vibrio nigripulchritudo MADA3029]